VTSTVARHQYGAGQDLYREKVQWVCRCAGDSTVILPGVEHHVELSTDAKFYVQFFREPGAPIVPGVEHADSVDRSGPWTPRRRDLDTEDEIFEMVTRQYVDVGHDEFLQPYFDFGPGFIDWQAGYEIDTIEAHRHLHDTAPFTPELFDRWLQVFEDTVDGAWAGPKADAAKKRATGMAWAMAQRFLGHGVWRPEARR
jgi:hemoglobin